MNANMSTPPGPTRLHPAAPTIRVQSTAAASTLPPPLQQPMLQLPMLLPPMLQQICCCFCNQRVQPNLQPPEMGPNPHKGIESAKGSYFWRDKNHKLFIFFQNSSSPRRKLKKCCSPKKKNAVHNEAACQKNCMQNKISVCQWHYKCSNHHQSHILLN